MPNSDLDREVSALRQRVADLERRLASYSDGQSTELTARSELGVTISEREELLVEAERVAHLGSWIWNVENDRVQWSAELFRILGYDPAGAPASTAAFFAAVHPDDVERVRATSARGVKTGVPEHTHFRVLRPDGSVRHVTMSGAFLYDAAGALRRIVGCVLDVTQAREAEVAMERAREQLARTQKIEAVGRLAGGVAHDLNNHLMVIQGNLEVLDLPESAELDALRSAIQSAVQTTSRLLAFGRQAPLQKRPTDVNQLVAQTMLLMQGVTPADIAVRSDLAADVGAVDVDSALVGQCIVNLVLNARDAGPRNIEVSTRRSASTPGAIEISVRDDGSGIDAATLNRVFEPFFTTKPRGKGSGLGLAMVQGTMSQHGGAVDLVSEPGRGSTFTLRLPALGFSSSSEAGSAQLGAPAAIGLPGREAVRRTILVVEDQAPVARVLESLLSADGHHVVVAERPARALALVAELRDQVALIICDIVMPEMRGPALIAEIRKAKQPCPPVLYMSGYSDDDIGSELVRLRKPFKRHELRAAIEEALRASG